MGDVLYSERAEGDLLGVLIMYPEKVAETALKLKPDDFYRQDYRVIYESVLDMHDAGELIDINQVCEHLKKIGKQDAGRWAETVLALVNRVYTRTIVPARIRTILQYSKRRQMVELGRAIMTIASDLSEEIDADELQTKISEIMLGDSDVITSIGDDLHAMNREINQRYKSGEIGIKTGYAKLDDALKGWQPSQFIIIAARPSVGKSAFALNCAKYAALHEHKKVAYFSFEMSKYEILSRLLSSQGKIQMDHFTDVKSLFVEDGRGQNEYDVFMKCANELEKTGLHIFDGAGNTPSKLFSICKLLQMSDGLDLVIVDYIQLMDGGKKFNSRAEEVSYISRSLKLIAMRLNVPVIGLSQFNRVAAHERQPTLADLRESGALEQDANIVLSLYPLVIDGYGRKIQLSTLKNRNGPLCEVTLDFFGRYTTFSQSQYQKSEHGGHVDVPL